MVGLSDGVVTVCVVLTVLNGASTVCFYIPCYVFELGGCDVVVVYVHVSNVFICMRCTYGDTVCSAGCERRAGTGGRSSVADHGEADEGGDATFTVVCNDLEVRQLLPEVLGHLPLDAVGLLQAQDVGLGEKKTYYMCLGRPKWLVMTQKSSTVP